MTTESTTKERIIEAAEGLMLDKSFHSVGLTEILSTVKLPKGSFYHHFESKEQFGIEMLRHYVANATAWRTKFLLSSTPEPDPYLRLMSFFEGIVAKVLANEGKCPCLISKLASEVADFSEPMRAVLAQGNRDWIHLYEQVLQEAITKKKIKPAAKPAQLAILLHDLLNGAMQRSSIERSATPLRDAIGHLRTILCPV
jgi:TetR/AcrR family transcriptional repressor of nem operon